MRQLSPRLTFATFIYVLCCLISTIRIIAGTPNPAHLPPDEVQRRSDERFASLKAALPQSGVVGYVGDANDTADYYLAQYALAPLVLEHSPNHPLVVGNFRSAPRPGLLSGLQVQTDFGAGVLLLANKDAK